MFHVIVYFLHIIIKEFQKQKRYVIYIGAINSLYEFPTDGRQ